MSHSENCAVILDELEHVKVEIQGLPMSLDGIKDSGAEISLIKASALKSMGIPSCGNLQVKGVVGQPVTAKLYVLNVTLEAPSGNLCEYRESSSDNLCCV